LFDGRGYRVNGLIEEKKEGSRSEEGGDFLFIHVAWLARVENVHVQLFASSFKLNLLLGENAGHWGALESAYGIHSKIHTFPS
jgi:hypothetical protein